MPSIVYIIKRDDQDVPAAVLEGVALNGYEARIVSSFTDSPQRLDRANITTNLRTCLETFVGDEVFIMHRDIVMPAGTMDRLNEVLEKNDCAFFWVKKNWGHGLMGIWRRVTVHLLGLKIDLSECPQCQWLKWMEQNGWTVNSAGLIPEINNQKEA